MPNKDYNKKRTMNEASLTCDGVDLLKTPTVSSDSLKDPVDVYTEFNERSDDTNEEVTPNEEFMLNLLENEFSDKVYDITKELEFRNLKPTDVILKFKNLPIIHKILLINYFKNITSFSSYPDSSLEKVLVQELENDLGKLNIFGYVTLFLLKVLKVYK